MQICRGLVFEISGVFNFGQKKPGTETVPGR
jgi:hypothetical protein